MELGGAILKAKYKNIKLHGADAFTRGGYTQMPNPILFSPDLTDSAKMAYAILLSYAWENDFCFPGQVKMGERWGKSERTVRRALTELEKTGYVRITQQGLGKTNLYELYVTIDGGKILDKRIEEPAGSDRTKMTGQDRTR